MHQLSRTEILFNKKSLLHFHRNKVDEFQAIRNVSFNVPKGNILGIVGKNGSGKSTMLNAIAGIFAPDSGTIDLKGNSVSLLSIGVGFQRELTGRENIILSGMLLGFSEKAVRERMEEIIDFRNLENLLMRLSERIPAVCIQSWHFLLRRF